MAEVKICGLTRAEDAACAAMLGATYLGVVMTESPRRVDPEAARAVFARVSAGAVRRVGVFGAEPVDEILRAADVAQLDVLQLAGERTDDEIERLRREFPGALWLVVRVRDGAIRPADRRLFGRGVGVVLDSWSRLALGGTGRRFDWRAVGEELAALRGGGTLVLAGGLTPETVRDGIAAFVPNVVDVSSGVEIAPGLKDHRRMAAFVAAAAGVAV